MLIAVKVWNEKLGLAIFVAIVTIGSSYKFYSTLLLSFIHCDIEHFPRHFMFSNMKRTCIENMFFSKRTP